MKTKLKISNKLRHFLLICVLLFLTVFFPACNRQETEDWTNEAFIRSSIIGADTKVKLADGTEVPFIGFDNAATTPSFRQVLEEIEKELEWYGSIGRGKGQKSEHSTAVFEEGRLAVLNFVGADPGKYTAFYVGNTTDGINKLASALIENPNDIVLLSRMEHHANDIPWRKLCRTVYADVDEMGRLVLEDVERLLIEYGGQIKFLSVTAASNVTGYLNDVHAIARIAHRHGAEIIVDGAQIVAHRPFSMTGADESENIDYFIFSAHKMYAPFGSGAVIGPTDRLNQHIPNFFGGSMVDVVTDSFETYLPAPARYEAGSPNYLGIVAMLKAIDILQNKIGFDYIVEHEQRLLTRIIGGLNNIPGIILYDDVKKIDDKVGLIVFNIDGLSSANVAQLFAERRGIAVRQGAFCSHPYVFRLLGIPDDQITQDMYEDDFSMPGMVRVSFGIYNTEDEVDSFLETVRQIAAELE